MSTTAGSTTAVRVRSEDKGILMGTCGGLMILRGDHGVDLQLVGEEATRAVRITRSSEAVHRKVVAILRTATRYYDPKTEQDPEYTISVAKGVSRLHSSNTSTSWRAKVRIACFIFGCAADIVDEQYLAAAVKVPPAFGTELRQSLSDLSVGDVIIWGPWWALGEAERAVQSGFSIDQEAAARMSSPNDHDCTQHGRYCEKVFMSRAALRAIAPPHCLRAAEAAATRAGSDSGAVSVSIDWPAASLRICGTAPKATQFATNTIVSTLEMWSEREVEVPISNRHRKALLGDDCVLLDKIPRLMKTPPLVVEYCIRPDKSGAYQSVARCRARTKEKALASEAKLRTNVGSFIDDWQELCASGVLQVANYLHTEPRQTDPRVLTAYAERTLESSSVDRVGAKLLRNGATTAEVRTTAAAKMLSRQKQNQQQAELRGLTAGNAEEPHETSSVDRVGAKLLRNGTPTKLAANMLLRQQKNPRKQTDPRFLTAYAERTLETCSVDRVGTKLLHGGTPTAETRSTAAAELLFRQKKTQQQREQLRVLTAGNARSTQKTSSVDRVGAKVMRNGTPTAEARPRNAAKMLLRQKTNRRRQSKVAADGIGTDLSELPRGLSAQLETANNEKGMARATTAQPVTTVTDSDDRTKTVPDVFSQQHQSGAVAESESGQDIGGVRSLRDAEEGREQTCSRDRVTVVGNGDSEGGGNDRGECNMENRQDSNQAVVAVSIEDEDKEILLGTNGVLMFLRGDYGVYLDMDDESNVVRIQGSSAATRQKVAGILRTAVRYVEPAVNQDPDFRIVVLSGGVELELIGDEAAPARGRKNGRVVFYTQVAAATFGCAAEVVVRPSPGHRNNGDATEQGRRRRQELCELVAGDVVLWGPKWALAEAERAILTSFSMDLEAAERKTRKDGWAPKDCCSEEVLMCRAALRAIASPEFLKSAEAKAVKATECKVSVWIDWPAASVRISGSSTDVVEAAAGVIHPVYEKWRTLEVGLDIANRHRRQLVTRWGLLLDRMSKETADLPLVVEYYARQYMCRCYSSVVRGRAETPEMADAINKKLRATSFGDVLIKMIIEEKKAAGRDDDKQEHLNVQNHDESNTVPAGRQEATTSCSNNFAQSVSNQTRVSNNQQKLISRTKNSITPELKARDETDVSGLDQAKTQSESTSTTVVRGREIEGVVVARDGIGRANVRAEATFPLIAVNPGAPTSSSRDEQRESGPENRKIPVAPPFRFGMPFPFFTRRSPSAPVPSLWKHVEAPRGLRVGTGIGRMPIPANKPSPSRPSPLSPPSLPLQSPIVRAVPEDGWGAGPWRGVDRPRNRHFSLFHGIWPRSGKELRWIGV